MTTTSPDGVRRVAAALGRLHSALAGRPGFGRSASTSVSVLGAGLRCETAERSWRIVSDLSAALGGEGAAPSPATLVRAALGACLAMSYRLQAAERGIELTSVRVTVETESELCGMLVGGADAPPGFTAVRYHVDIETPAPRSEIEHLLEVGDQLSPVLDMLTRAHVVARTTSITSVAA